MQRLAVLACLAVLTPTVLGKVMAPAPIPDRVALAEAVVVGKVTAIEEKPIAGKNDTTAYTVAVVKIDEALAGAKGLTHLKVGFVPQQGGRRRFPQLNLQVGQEALFFVRAHPELNVPIVSMYFDVVNKADNPEFAKEVALTKRCGKLLADPKAGFSSKDDDDRLLTAAMLIARAKTYPIFATDEPKQEMIDAELSKGILKTLADADWSKNSPELPGVGAQGLFMKLNLGPAEGWNPPPAIRDILPAAQRWCRDNAETHRLKGFVTPKK